MWGCPCKTVDLYLGQNSALVCSEGQLSRLSTKYLTTASRLRGDPQSWLIFVILFFLKTHSDVTAEDQLGLKVSWWGGSSSIWRSVFTRASRLPADLGNGHPEKVLQGLSHLLWTDVVNWMSWCLIGQKKKTKDLRDISFVAVCIFFLIISHYIPLVGGTAVSLLWCSFNIFITGSCHHPPRLFYWFIWELHTTKKPTTLWAENTIAQAL